MTQPQPQISARQNGASANLWPGRDFPLPWLVGLGLMIFGLRLPFIGHVVSWDEAWNLCALRELAGGGGANFTLQFWRHPPTYLLLGRLLHPLQAGLDARMQLLSLALNCGAILAFVILVSRLFGRQVALYTGLAYALLPGALFFDTWIKHDPVATLFGILSLLAYFRRKNWLAGLLLGLAFLGKETAVYYAFPFLILPALLPYRTGKLAGICLIFGLAFGVSCWWYLQMAVTRGSFLAMFLGSSFEASQFIEPWWYYLVRLRLELGLSGLVLLAVGLVAFFRKVSGCRRPWWRQLLRPRLMPLTILAPVYLLLSLSQAKPAWMTMGLYPPLALIVGCGWLFVSKILLRAAGIIRLSSRLKGGKAPLLFGPLLLLVLGLPVAGFWGRDGYRVLYEDFAPQSLQLMQPSYTMAEALNRFAGAGEKLLLMPMLYRDGPHMPDPIFSWQLKVPLVVVRIKKENNLDYQTLRAMIITQKINWLLMSPLEGSDQSGTYKELFNNERSPQCYILLKTVLLRVDSLWKGNDSGGRIAGLSPAGGQ